MGKFKINDRHIAFCNAIAGGMEQWEAYMKFMAVNPNCTKKSAGVTASKLMAKGEIQEIVANARRARGEAITQVIARNIAEEFSTTHLTVDELDSWHYAVIQGKVDMEEVVPQYTWNEVLDESGKVVKRQKIQSFVRIKRPPNIREKQISVDAIYKRNGNYAPTRGLFGVKNLDNDETEDNVERVVILSDGTKIPLLQ